MFSAIEILYFLLPILTGTVMTVFCPMDTSAGEIVKFRPPSWVFSLVWPILYFCLGYSWVISSRKSNLNIIPYSILTTLLAVWIFVYSCKDSKKDAAFVLLASIVAIFLCFAVGNKLSKILLAPLIGWLIFALIMNTTEVQETK